MQLQAVCFSHGLPSLTSSSLQKRRSIDTQRCCSGKPAGNKTRTFYLPNSDLGTAAHAPHLGKDGKLVEQEPSDVRAIDSREAFHGKSGSVSFCGLTHQVVEEGKLVSAPFEDGTGSLVWVLGPIALISSLLLPQFIVGGVIEAVVKNDIFAEIISSIASEAIFYAGLATFLLVTNHVQRPYLQFSAKRWGLITGLKGYLTSAFFTMGFKVVAPIFAVFAVWPVLGLPALVAVAPFLLGCGAQFVFEKLLDGQRSSCWPLVPIIFEVYRLYQLNKGAHFIEKLMFSIRGRSPDVLEKSGAMVSMLVLLQVLGLVCLWSLVTFLLRLFPSRPVAEKY